MDKLMREVKVRGYCFASSWLNIVIRGGLIEATMLPKRVKLHSREAVLTVPGMCFLRAQAHGVPLPSILTCR